jgi:hypothetical protein
MRLQGVAHGSRRAPVEDKRDLLAPTADADLGQRAVASRRIRIAGSRQRAFAPIQRIGSKTGWYYANGFWGCAASWTSW